jgi:glycosyltransferase involved in cell wall biosynthesis
MRLTIINQFYRPDISPTAQLCGSLGEDRARRGDEVTVIASQGGYTGDRTRAKHDAGAAETIHRVWTPQLGKGSIVKRLIDYGFFYLGAFWRALRLPRQDVIICLTTPPFIALAGYLHKALHRKTKLVIWCMDCYPEVAERSGHCKPNGLAASVMRFLNRFLMKRVDYIIGLDTAMVEMLSVYCPAKRPVPAVAISNWEPAARYPASADPPPLPWLEEQGLTEKLVVLYSGNMGVGHEFDTALDVAERLLKEGDDSIVFIFNGKGARRGYIEEQVAARSLSNVIVRDYVPLEDVPSLLAGASCALITLRDDMRGVMSPSKLHANLAMRLPVLYIGPEHTNVDDCLVRFGCGLSLRQGQVEEALQFLKGLSEDAALLESLKRKAREAFDAAYCDEKAMPQFERVFQELLQDRAAPARSENR